MTLLVRFSLTTLLSRRPLFRPDTGRKEAGSVRLVEGNAPEQRQLHHYSLPHLRWAVSITSPRSLNRWAIASRYVAPASLTHEPIECLSTRALKRSLEGKTEDGADRFEKVGKTFGALHIRYLGRSGGDDVCRRPSLSLQDATVCSSTLGPVSTTTF